MFIEGFPNRRFLIKVSVKGSIGFEFMLFRRGKCVMKAQGLESLKDLMRISG